MLGPQISISNESHKRTILFRKKDTKKQFKNFIWKVHSFFESLGAAHPRSFFPVPGSFKCCLNEWLHFFVSSLLNPFQLCFWPLPLLALIKFSGLFSYLLNFNCSVAFAPVDHCLLKVCSLSSICYAKFASVQLRCSVMSDSLHPHGL